MPDHPMSDEERAVKAAAQLAWWWRMTQTDDPDDPRGEASFWVESSKFVVAALGPQLTAEEAKHMLTTYVFPPCSDCDAIRAKLSLIAQGEKP